MYLSLGGGFKKNFPPPHPKKKPLGFFRNESLINLRISTPITELFGIQHPVTWEPTNSP